LEIKTKCCNFAFSLHKYTKFYKHNTKNRKKRYKNQKQHDMIRTKPNIKTGFNYSKIEVSRRLRMTRPAIDKAEKRGELAGLKLANGRTVFPGQVLLDFWKFRSTIV
jgi:hypothetical protein